MINVHGVNPAAGAQGIDPVGAANAAAAPKQPIAINDVVEISTAAKLTARINELPDIRADLVAQVKAQIEAGAYETPQRIEATVDRLMDELFPSL
jgi:anti-sigma28 factor (negative regulator of flagellin synthesis)